MYTSSSWSARCWLLLFSHNWRYHAPINIYWALYRICNRPLRRVSSASGAFVRDGESEHGGELRLLEETSVPVIGNAAFIVTPLWNASLAEGVSRTRPPMGLQVKSLVITNKHTFLPINAHPKVVRQYVLVNLLLLGCLILPSVDLYLVVQIDHVVHTYYVLQGTGTDSVRPIPCH